MQAHVLHLDHIFDDRAVVSMQSVMRRCDAMISDGF
jgi:hypothetical protein